MIGKIKIPILIGILYFFMLLSTLTDYNIYFDAVNHLPRGQAYLHYFLTGNRDYSDLQPFKKYWQKPESLAINADMPSDELSFRSYYQHDSFTLDYFLRTDGDGHPPLSDIISSVSNLVFFQKLKLINDIDSYRIIGILLASGLVAFIYYWSSKLYGKFSGLVSSFVLATYPLYWSQAHFNTEKDIPETVYFSFFIYSFWKAVITKQRKWVIFSGILFGLALGTKLNVAFSIFIIVPWLFYYIWKSKLKLNLFNYVNLGLIPIIGIGILFITWPYLWSDPIYGIQRVFRFYLGLGLAKTSNLLLPVSVVPTYGLQTVLYITYPIVLFFVIIGLFNLLNRIKKEKDKVSLLFLLWFLVPIVRVSLPGTNIHGGARQIMEYIPAMAIISGVGAKYLYDLSKNITYRISFFAMLLLSLMMVIFGLIKLHPYEELYANSFAGGLSGLKARNYPYWGETYGAPYRLAVKWINDNAEPNAKVVFAYELMPNIPGIFIRPDIDFYNTLRTGYLMEGEYAVTLVSKGTDIRSYYDMYLERFLKPVYEGVVDGVPIIKVWKNDREHLINDWRENIDEDAVYEITDKGLTFQLSNIHKLSRLEISYSEDDCSDLGRGIINISKDKKEWEVLPGTLPDDWRISALRQQPEGGSFIEPFVGQEAQFIRLDLYPSNTCLKRLKNYRVFYFE